MDFSPTAILPEREGSNSKLNPTIKDPDEADATQKLFSKNPESSSGARVTPEKEKYQTNLKAEINASGKAKAYCQICKQMVRKKYDAILISFRLSKNLHTLKVIFEVSVKTSHLM